MFSTVDDVIKAVLEITMNQDKNQNIHFSFGQRPEYMPFGGPTREPIGGMIQIGLDAKSYGKEGLIKNKLFTKDPYITKRKNEHIYISLDMTPQKFERKITEAGQKIIVPDDYVDNPLITYIQYEKDGPWHKISSRSIKVSVGKPFHNIRFYLNSEPESVKLVGIHFLENDYWGDEIPGLGFI